MDISGATNTKKPLRGNRIGTEETQVLTTQHLQVKKIRNAVANNATYHQILLSSNYRQFSKENR